MDLAEFLLARIAEDERAATGILQLSHLPPSHFTAGRMLAECEAKRRIVVKGQQAQRSIDSADRAATSIAADGHVIALREVVKLLALPYADHPDYRKEWRP